MKEVDTENIAGVVLHHKSVFATEIDLTATAVRVDPSWVK